MKRRDFIQTSLVVGGATSLTGMLTAQAAESPGGREFYELRRYHLRRGPQQKTFDDYAGKALLPALNRLGIMNVGVFGVGLGPASPSMTLLIPFQSLEQFATMTPRLRADPAYLDQGAEFINAPATAPAYERVESALMIAFEGMPKLEVPEKKARVFELRTYESHSKKANLKKVEMFDVGEIAIFRRAGLRPVFFGNTIIGTQLPNLTYMLVYDDMAARDKAWSAFGGDPEWKKLSTTPGYTDPEIVSNISNSLLRPTGYSQI